MDSRVKATPVPHRDSEQHDDDRRRQLIEVTTAGAALLDADRTERDTWLNAAMRDTLTDLEFDLLMLVAPVLRKLADADPRTAQ